MKVDLVVERSASVGFQVRLLRARSDRLITAVNMVDADRLILGAAVLVARADRLGAVRGGRDRTATERNARCHR
jgi:hypothetical protein